MPQTRPSESFPSPFPPELPGPARRELGALIDASPPFETVAERLDGLPHLKRSVEACRQELERGRRFAVLELAGADGPLRDFARIETGIGIVAHAFGEVLPQDASGSRAIHVWDRDPSKRMADGARYHQTHEGGSIHTDNVNQPEIWDYLVFGCLESARAGGETLLVNALELHDELATSYPDVLEVLRGDFVWEYRGLRDDTYTAPIISYDEAGECQFRYLRPYMESAHRKVGQELTAEQTYALDVLDALLEESRLQTRLTLRRGQVLLTKDCQVLHGRTTYVDPPGARPVAEARPGDPVKRTMIRYWIRKRP